MRAQLRLGWLMAEGAWERTELSWIGLESAIRSRVARQIYSKRYSGGGMDVGDNEPRVPDNSR
jgi:hypothetical protein